MKKQSSGKRFEDVRWLDEVALYREAVAGNREAFAEVIERFDPVVRAQLARVVDAESLETELALFWLGLLRSDRAGLRGWDAERGGLLAQWLVLLLIGRPALTRAA